jgi:WD40 repeat protein
LRPAQAEDIAVGGQLCSMLYELAELKASLDPIEVSGIEEERKAAEAELLSGPESLEFPQAADKVFANIHGANIISARYSPDGATIATGSTDRSVKIVNATDGKPIRTVAVHGLRLPTRARAREPPPAASAARVQRAAARSVLPTWPGAPGAPVLAVAFCPTNPAQLLSSAMDGSAILRHRPAPPPPSY